ncbi:MAG: hypothetical protein R2877_07040 [Bdellovibrionota bacterium]
MMRKLIIAALIPTMLLASCARSRISSGNGSPADSLADPNVGFNPSTTANLKTLNYKAHLNRLNNLFQLNSSSDTVQYLQANRQIFDTHEYTSSLATSLVALYSTACQEVANNTILFPNGIEIDYLWNKLTGEEADESAKKLETDTLAVVQSQPNDVKAFALCVNASLDAKSVFIGFQTVEALSEPEAE